MPVASMDATIVAGSTPVVTMTTRDIDGALETPAGITLVHRAPDGTEVTYTSPNAAITLGVTTGISRFIFPTGVVAGRHVVHIRAAGTETTAAQTIRLNVRPDGTDSV